MKSVAVAVLVLLSLSLPTSLAGCTSWSTSHPEVAAGGLYFDNDVCQPNCLLSAWIYQESNGIAGLQRGDAWVDDTCGGQIMPDRRIL